MNTKEVVSRIVDDTSKKPNSIKELQSVSETERVELDGRSRFFDLRDKWSKYIFFWISFIIAFDMFITILVGFGCLNFHNHKWLLPTMITNHFLQILGMGVVVVKFLFADKSKRI